MKQYEAVVSKAIPALAPEPESLESDPSWSPEQAEAAFFQRLTLEEEVATDRGRAGEGLPRRPIGKVPLSASQATWRNVSTLYAAGILLIIALGVSAYQVGIHRGVKTAAVTPATSQKNPAALEQQVSDAGHEREVSARSTDATRPGNR